MKQLTIFDINKISQDQINDGKGKMLCKIDKAYSQDKISEKQYFKLKRRVDIYLDYSKDEGNLEDDNE